MIAQELLLERTPGMKFHAQKIRGMFLIEPESFSDERGMFRRHFCEREFAAHGISTVIRQCNVSENRAGHTLRGLHYQLPPHSEGKTVSCLRGAIYCVVADLRPYSQTYLEWVGAELDERNRLSMYVPSGCANGFLTMEENSMIYYICTNFHEPAAGRGIRYNDPLFGFKWPATPAVISDKDRNYPNYVPAPKEIESTQPSRSDE